MITTNTAARRSVWKTQHAHFAAMRKQIRASVASSKLDAKLKTFILALAGIEGHAERLLASDTEVTKRASRILLQEIAELHKRKPNASYYVMTFCDDVGIISNRMPMVPLATLEAKVRRQLAKLGVDAIGVIQTHPLMNYPGGGEGGNLLYHVRVLAWTSHPLNHIAAKNELNASRAWGCRLGAPPVDIQPVNNTLGDLRQAAANLIMPPFSAKKRMPRTGAPDRFRLEDTIEGYQPELALRVMEGLSQVEFCSLVFGHGSDGAAVRQKLRSRIEAWHRGRPRDRIIVPCTTDVWELWLQARESLGSTHYKPYRFDRLNLPNMPRSNKNSQAHAASKKRRTLRGTRKRRFDLKCNTIGINPKKKSRKFG